MKCRECSACNKGWFKSKPNDYVCTGVKEPFVINDINVECTEYPEKRRKNKCLEDCLVIGVDLSNDGNALTVARRIKDNKLEVLKVFRNDEAYDLYEKLVGER